MSLSNLELILPLNWKSTVHTWLEEDIPSFDFAACVVGDEPRVAYLLGKAEGVIAGKPFFDEVFKTVGCDVEWHVDEGNPIVPIAHCATVRGPAYRILQGERTALNMLARASGIATRARKVFQEAQERGFTGRLAGTRKTTPGFRLVEKYALLVGGVDAHRYSLSSMVMLKDNHIWSTGCITTAVSKARQAVGFSVKVEVEARSYEEAREAFQAGADVVMLDNFEADEMKTVATRLKKEYPNKLLEVSGGITPETVADYMHNAVDVISMGSLTQGVPHIDFSLKIQKDLISTSAS